MSPLAATLTLLWAVQEPASATTSRPSCERTDNACKAKMFVKKAATAEPARRALYLFTASRSYLALFAQTGDVKDLCAARTNFDQSLAVSEQTESQRASFEESRAELEALEKKHGARCRPSHRRKQADPKVVARSTPAPPVTTEPPSSTRVTAAPPTPAPLDLLDASSAPLEPEATNGELLAVHANDSAGSRPPTAPTPANSPTVPPQPRAPGRPLAIGGGVTLGVGVVLAGVAGYASSQVAAASRASYDLYDQTQGHGGLDVLAEQTQIHRDYNRWLPVTIGTAIAGSTAVIAGAVMLRLGIQRMKQGSARAALVPVPGGLAIHARF